jgi:hypothetical protein
VKRAVKEEEVCEVRRDTHVAHVKGLVFSLEEVKTVGFVMIDQYVRRSSLVVKT